jgi:hypothetical protein
MVHSIRIKKAKVWEEQRILIQKRLTRGRRLGHVAAAVSSSASALDATSRELVGGSIPSVLTVAAVVPALIVGIARVVGPARPGTTGVVEAAATATTGSGSSSWWRWRSGSPVGTRTTRGGLDDGLLLHLLDQFDGDSGVAGLVTMDRIRRPVRNHGVQYL